MPRNLYQSHTVPALKFYQLEKHPSSPPKVLSWILNQCVFAEVSAENFSFFFSTYVGTTKKDYFKMREKQILWKINKTYQNRAYFEKSGYSQFLS